MNPLADRDFCAALILALAHFLWQGTLIAGLTLVMIRRFKSSYSRYRLLVASLAGMGLSPLVTMSIQVVQINRHVPTAVSPAKVESALPAVQDIAAQSTTTGTQPTGSQLPQVATNEVPADIPESPIPPAPIHSNSRWQRFAPLLANFYLLGVAAMLLRLMVGLWGGWRLRLGSRAVEDVALLQALRRQAQSLGMKFVPILAYCERVSVPTVIGILKPTILLPLTLTSGLAFDQVEAVLAHELAHLRRYDHLVNLLQRVLESLLFFHPAVWILSSRVRIEREHCCDDLVVATGAVPLEYAKSLLRVAELSHLARRHRSVSVVSLLVTGQPSTLRQRIARLLGETADSHVRLQQRWLAYVLGSVCLFVAWTTTQVGWGFYPETPESPNVRQQHIAELPSGAMIEMVSVGYHQSNIKKWWNANGSPFAREPHNPQLKSVDYVTINAGKQQHECREFTIVIKGLPVGEKVFGWQFLYGKHGDAVHRGVIREPSEFRIAEMPPLARLGIRTAALRICLDELPEELVRSFGLDGKKLGNAPATAEMRRIDDLIQPIRVESVQDQTELILKEFSRAGNPPFAEYVPQAIDKAGVKHDSIRAGGREGVMSYLYPIARDMIVRFEYRLKLYQRWVTFENISLFPDEPSKVNVVVDTLPVATVPVVGPTVTGTVLGDDGKPVAGIDVVAYQGEIQLPQKFTTDDKGQIQVPKAWRDVDHFLTLVARDGTWRIGWFDFFLHGHSDHGQKTADGSFKLVLLPRFRTIHGQLLNLSGTPLKQVAVRVEFLQHDVNFGSTAWQRRMIDGKPILPEAITGDDGQFEMQVPNDTVGYLRTMSPDWIGRRLHFNRDRDELPAARLAPAAKVAGRVTDARTGKPVKGVGIGAQALKPDIQLGGWGDTVTDQDGRYVIGGLGAGDHNILVLETPDKQLTSIAQSGIGLKAGETARADFSLIVGRKLSGRVVDDATNKSLAECVVGYHGPARPQTGGGILSTKTNERGEFELFVPPGVSHVYIAEDREPLANSERDVEVPVDHDPEPVLLRAGPVSAMKIKVFVGSPLDLKVSLDARRMPLQDALQHLCGQANVKLELDGDGLKWQGYTKNMPVSVKLDSVTLRDALSRVLQPYEKLTFTEDKDVVFVSSLERVEARERGNVNPPGPAAQGLKNEDLKNPKAAPLKEPTSLDDEGLGFLSPYPKLRKLSLKMTEQDFQKLVEQEKLTARRGNGTDDRPNYYISTGDGHQVIVMFFDGKCRGIQRIRGDDPGDADDVKNGGRKGEVIESVAENLITLANGKVIATDKDTQYFRRTNKGETPNARSELKVGVVVQIDTAPTARAASRVIVLNVQKVDPPQNHPAIKSPEKAANETETKEPAALTPTWGQPTNGLRARIRTVSAAMSEDAIDFEKMVSEFQQADDIAFVVELENVTDKPIKLLDTRYGDGYGDSKGKANSNWYGQFLFSIDYYTADGKLIERPAVQVVDLNTPLDGALVAELEPGKVHQILLRPAKWLSSLRQRLEPGQYQAVIRYHGLPTRVADRIKEYRPTSPVLETVSGDITSGRVTFVINSTEADKNAINRPRLVWGNVNNGLRAAMEFTPHKVGYQFGEKVDVKLYVQNVGEKPVTLASHLWMSGVRAKVKNEQGAEVDLQVNDYSGWTLSGRITLQPSQLVIFDAGNLGLAKTAEQAEKFEHIINRILIGSTGKYSIQLTEHFGHSFLLKDGKGKQLAPLDGDYTGELTTGNATLVVSE